MQAAALVVLSAGLARAEDDLSRFRPMPRPSQTADAPGPMIRPQPRPTELAPAPEIAALDDMPKIRPMPRPQIVAVQPVIAAPAPQGKPQAPVKGALCQRADLRGKVLPPIESSFPGCSVPDAVLVSQVAGVRLSPPATINCEEAVALSNWVSKGLQPAFSNSIVALNVVDSYACRPRNNVRGAQTSVHGLGQAIDISGFVTKSGRTYTVAQNYNAQIRAAQKAGCGTFHTILGPGSDGYHENHIHFDVAHHHGDYCH